MSRFIAIIFLLCSSYYQINAQNTDSLLHLLRIEDNSSQQFHFLEELTQTYFSLSQIDSAKYFAQLAIENAQQNNNDQNELKILYLLIRSYYTRGDFQKADSLVNDALELDIPKDEKIKLFTFRFRNKLRQGNIQDRSDLDKVRQLISDDTLGLNMAQYYANSGVYEYERRNYWEALSNYQKANELFPEDHPMKINIRTGKATIYTSLGLFTEALKLEQQNLKYYIENKDYEGQLFSYFGIGNMQVELEQNDSLKRTCFDALKLSERENITVAIGFIYNLLCRAYIAENKLDSALQYARQGLYISTLQNEQKEITDNHLALAKAFHAQENRDSALYYAKLTSKNTSRIDALDLSRLAHILELNGDKETAVEILKQSNFYALRQIKNNASTVEKFAKAQVQEEKEGQEKEYRQDLFNQRMYAIFAILFISLLAFVALYYNQTNSARKLKKLNESLEDRNEALKQFAYITSHDLKEPIRNINSFTQILKQNLGKLDETKQQKYLEYISNGSKTLYEIVTALQTFTSVQFNKIEREEVIIEEVFEAIQTNLSSFIKEKNGLVLFENQEPIKKVSFAKSMLILVLQNLVQNGLKYNQSQQPTVKLSIKRKEGKVLFTITDNGEGIEEKYFESIFKPFKTLQNKSLIKSSGLGLSICKNIVKSYNGEIWVESEVGKGSNFYVLI
jgi:signal transduction histidine kinase